MLHTSIKPTLQAAESVGVMTEARTFSGRVIPDDGEPLDVEVVVARDMIRMVSGVTEIGTWSVPGCHLEPAGDDAFTIGEDGDAVRFEPDDSPGFQDVVESVAAGSLAPLFANPPAAAEQALDSGGPFEIDVTVAGDPGGEIEIDPGPEDAGVGTGYVDTVSEIDLPGFANRDESAEPETGEHFEPSDQDQSAGPEAAEPEADEQSEPSEPSGQDQSAELEAGDDDHTEPLDEPEVDETSDVEPSEPAYDEADLDDASAGVADAGAGDPQPLEGLSDDPAFSVDETSEESPEESPESEVSDDVGGPELRRSFGQRLSRRRIPPPPATPIEGTEGGSQPTEPAPSLEAGEAGIDLEAISAGVADPVSDTAALAAAVDALRENVEPGEISGTTVADTILEAQRSLRSSSSKASDLPDRMKKAAVFLGVLILLGGLGLGGYLAFQILVAARPAESVPTTVAAGGTTTPAVSTPPATTVPSSTAVPTTTAPRQPTAFELSAPEFVARWNDTADRFNPALRLPSLLPGDFEFQLTPYIAALGSVGETGSIAEITLLIDPSGPSDSDALGIQAMGVMIAAVDPNLDGQERKSLLASMGFDVEKPSLVGVDGLSARNGVAYRLVYDSEAVELRFTASPG